MSYNGWTNYETWVVALWVDSEPYTYETRCDMAEPFTAPEDADEWTEDPDFYEEVGAEACPGKPCGADCDHKVRVHNVSGYADAIQAFVENDLMPDLWPCLASDLLSSALSEVNWREIAKNWLEE